jgi:hypothetical protein
MNFIQYVKQVWKAGTSGGTPLSPDRLNHMEDGIKNNNSMISELSNNNITNNICTNLLNPTLETSSNNGITCTNNGDGTYTLNGKATSAFILALAIFKKRDNKKYKLIGTPSGGSSKTYNIYADSTSGFINENGEGAIFNASDLTNGKIMFFVGSGVTVNNLVFKPMITTNLNATYDDFVPYTGDTGRLNADVALLENKINKYFINTNETIYIPLRTMLLIYETAFDMGAYVVRSEAGNTKIFLHSIKENSKVNIGLGDNGKIKITNTANTGGDILTIVY